METMVVGPDESVTTGAVVGVELSACEVAVVEEVSAVVREVSDGARVALVVVSSAIEVSITVVVEAKLSSTSVVSVASPPELLNTAKPTIPKIGRAHV